MPDTELAPPGRTEHPGRQKLAMFLAVLAVVPGLTLLTRLDFATSGAAYVRGLESAGIVFIDQDGQLGPGVRLRQPLS